ncbi:hypothetical protein FQA39_LY09614 [Lamprigera yunnana]|nr:hypothetical protein FQA39_LY09614 [Lamprigera yunnana]
MQSNDVPFQTQYDESVGKFAVAKNDLQQGDLIFSESAFAFGPKSGSPPLCLGCYVPVDCSVRCSLCNWPVCSSNCETTSAHKNAECVIFTKARVNFQSITNITETCLQYECVTPLRVLLAMLDNTKRWNEEVKDMEAHNLKRRNEFVWKFNQINIVNYIRGPCRLQNFSEDLIHTVCGILECNAFEARSKSGYPIRCLFPQLAILSHNCVPNIVHTITEVDTDCFGVVVRAAVDVKKGDELFSSYTYVLWPSIIRRQYLKDSKYFNCTCIRCADSTEMGTHMSSLICDKCNIGILSPSAPLDDGDWKCGKCENFITNVDVKNLFETIQNEIDAANGSTLEELLQKYIGILHPHNSYIISIKLMLIPVYRHTDSFKSIQFCKDVLHVLNVIQPGCTRIRGTTLYELYLSTITLACTLEEQDERLTGELKKALKILNECILILKYEPESTLEGKIYVAALKQMNNLERYFENITDRRDVLINQ